MLTMFVSVIIPAHRKEKTIQKNVRHIYEALLETRYEFEIITVVDGTSLDATFSEAKKFRRENVSVVGYERNRGKGYAIRYGMARAKGEFIAFIDAGMEIEPNGISMILEHMQWYNADIIVGSKRHPASKVKFPFIRQIYSYGYHFIVRILFRLNVRDTQSGLKVYKRKVLEDVLPRLVVKEFAFDVELLVVANHLGYRRIYEAPIEVDLSAYKDASTFKSFLFLDPMIRNMFMDTLSIFYRLYVLRYYDTGNKRRWVYDSELDMRVNTGESGK